MVKLNISGFISLIIVVIAVILTSSWLQGNITLLSRGWVWLGLGCVMCLLAYPPYIKQKNNMWLLAYAAIVVLNFFMGDSYFHSIVNVIMEVAMLLFCSYLAFYITEDKKIINIFVYSQLLVVVATAVLSITVNMIFPGVIRDTVTLINAGYSSKAIPFYRIGVCEYGYPHGIPMILPGLVLLYKNHRLKLIYRIIALSIVVLLFYLVFISGVTTALILTIFGILASFFIRQDDVRKNVTRLVILGILMMPLLNDDAALGVLKFAEQVVPEDNKITGKIANFEETIQNSNTADGTIQTRGELYGMSISGFFSNPIIGINDKSYGEHSAILDRFATLGLLGGIPFLLFILFLYKMIKQRIPSHSMMFFYIGMAGFLIMLATKNMNNIYVWLYSICLLPALLLFNSNPPKFIRK